MDHPQIIVGISGGSGSGKTTVLRQLVNHYDTTELCIVSQDNYYHPIEKQKADANGIINFDLPESIDADLLLSHLDLLRRGQTVDHIEYTFNNEGRASTSIKLIPAPVIVIEGLFVFHIEEIRKELDLSVFVHAEKETRLNRRIERDLKERGYPQSEVEYQWKHHVEPAYDNFLKPYIDQCDLVINNDLNYEDGIKDLINLIQRTKQ